MSVILLWVCIIEVWPVCVSVEITAVTTGDSEVVIGVCHPPPGAVCGPNINMVGVTDLSPRPL